ncbi:MAG: hypothetical protein FWF59_00805 [Turicibacter sp.]|nr:hypothetical protein [Turicibacter sp.]
MEKEMLDLIRSFEQASKKMESLDGIIGGFGQVVQSLQSHLDELIEMVHLEGIVALSKTTAEKLSAVSAGMEEAIKAQQKTIQLAGLLSAPGMSQSPIAFGTTVYSLAGDKITAQDHLAQKTWEIPLTGAKKLAVAPIGAFALADGGIFLLEDEKAHPILESRASDFYVHGNRLAYLEGGSLNRFHLITGKTQLMATGVLSVSPLPMGHALLVASQEGEQVAFI